MFSYLLRKFVAKWLNGFVFPCNKIILVTNYAIMKYHFSAQHYCNNYETFAIQPCCNTNPFNKNLYRVKNMQIPLVFPLSRKGDSFKNNCSYEI
jgi:hypothetical protein